MTNRFQVVGKHRSARVESSTLNQCSQPSLSVGSYESHQPQIETICGRAENGAHLGMSKSTCYVE